MLRFWWLSQRGVVQAPILSTGEVGIRVEGRTLSVGERIFRLTDSGSFRMPKDWAPVIQSPDYPNAGLPLIQFVGAPTPAQTAEQEYTQDGVPTVPPNGQNVIRMVTK